MEVRHEPQHGRFTIDHGDAMSVLQYRMADEGVMHMIRTFVASEYREQGHGAMLVRAALDHAREQGYRITSSCWFVDAFVDAHEEYQPLRA